MKSWKLETEGILGMAAQLINSQNNISPCSTSCTDSKIKFQTWTIKCPGRHFGERAIPNFWFSFSLGNSCLKAKKRKPKNPTTKMIVPIVKITLTALKLVRTKKKEEKRIRKEEGRGENVTVTLSHSLLKGRWKTLPSTTVVATCCALSGE